MLESESARRARTELWASSVGRFEQAVEQERRLAWIRHHQRLAALFGRLAQEHDEKARKLLEAVKASE
jgi:hypothetical protein